MELLISLGRWKKEDDLVGYEPGPLEMLHYSSITHTWPRIPLSSAALMLALVACPLLNKDSSNIPDT